nr:MAG: replication associated protein [Cressdnaviricota sp.]
MTTARNWCFTLNNPTAADDLLLNFDNELWTQNVKFAIWMLEYSQELTPHYQGYLELHQPRRLSWFRERLPRAHLEARRGSREAAIHYCTKTLTKENSQNTILSDSEELGSSSTREERWNSQSSTTGESSAQRSRGPFLYGYAGSWQELLASFQKKTTTKERLLSIKERLSNGASEEVIADDDFDLWVKYHRSFERYRTIKSKPRNHEVEVIVIQGPTGTGKSKWAMEEYPGAYWKQRSIWWDGFVGQDTVIIDEFYGWLPFDTLLRICDRYPMLVETKGGQVNFDAKRVVITTNAIPNSWYKNVYFPSFVRRVNTWMVFPVWGERQCFTEYTDAISKFVNNQ